MKMAVHGPAPMLVPETSGTPSGTPAEVQVPIAVSRKLIAFGTGKGPSSINALSPASPVRVRSRPMDVNARPGPFRKHNELVSPIGPLSGSHAAALAGANTPLAWGQASLFRAASLSARFYLRR